MPRDNSRRAEISAFLGATGSGKSTAINLRLEADDGARRIVFDPGEDFGAHGTVVDSERAAYRLVTSSPRWRVVFRPSIRQDRARAQFDWLCRLAYAAGDCLFVADELEDYMSASWAPDGWRRLVRLGRKRGCRIIAASQVPAGIEKRFWDQATFIRCGRLNGESSARTVAGVLMVDWRRLVALPDLEFYQRAAGRDAVTHGRIEWRRGAPVEVKISSLPIISPAVP